MRGFICFLGLFLGFMGLLIDLIGLLIHISVNISLNDTFVIYLIHNLVNICLNDTFVIWGDLDSLIFVRLVGLGRPRQSQLCETCRSGET